jgi:16S rRNA (cytosine1402-N4)-methyltransferase
MTKHIPVLLTQTIELLQPKRGGTYIDATLGGGGHTLLLLEALGEGTVLSIDQDLAAIALFIELLQQKKWKKSGDAEFIKGKLKLILQRGNFKNIKDFVQMHKLTDIKGIMADLGLSSDQLEDNARGFSFMSEGELDMRMSDDIQVKAKDLLNGLYKKEMNKLFEMYGDLEFADRLVNKILDFRKEQPLTTADQLKDIIRKVVPAAMRTKIRNPEARVFQALRIAVNDELNSLKQLLENGFELLCPGGRMAVISFHSGEDRIVKTFFQAEIKAGNAEQVTELLRPESLEILENSRSSSAKLRVVSKI